jgi:hypothetical protein
VEALIIATDAGRGNASAPGRELEAEASYLIFCSNLLPEHRGLRDFPGNNSSADLEGNLSPNSYWRERGDRTRSGCGSDKRSIRKPLKSDSGRIVLETGHGSVSATKISQHVELRGAREVRGAVSILHSSSWICLCAL